MIPSIRSLVDPAPLSPAASPRQHQNISPGTAPSTLPSISSLLSTVEPQQAQVGRVPAKGPLTLHGTTPQRYAPYSPPEKGNAGRMASPMGSSGEEVNPKQGNYSVIRPNSPQSVSSYVSNSSERYVCGQCEKSFSRPSSLRIHSYSHTGERPFVCSHSGCGRAFSVRSNMRRHMRVHESV